jgi:hypothetical protein
VRAELDAYPREEGFEVKRLSKGAPDQSLAAVSREERLVIVTNDEDFSVMPSAKVFSVVLLRLPQRDVDALHGTFDPLLAECKDWKECLILLDRIRWKPLLLSPKRKNRRNAA